MEIPGKQKVSLHGHGPRKQILEGRMNLRQFADWQKSKLGKNSIYVLASFGDDQLLERLLDSRNPRDSRDYQGFEIAGNVIYDRRDDFFPDGRIIRDEKEQTRPINNIIIHAQEVMTETPEGAQGEIIIAGQPTTTIFDYNGEPIKTSELLTIANAEAWSVIIPHYRFFDGLGFPGLAKLGLGLVSGDFGQGYFEKHPEQLEKVDAIETYNSQADFFPFTRTNRATRKDYKRWLNQFPHLGQSVGDDTHYKHQGKTYGCYPLLVREESLLPFEKIKKRLREHKTTGLDEKNPAPRAFIQHATSLALKRIFSRE